MISLLPLIHTVAAEPALTNHRYLLTTTRSATISAHHFTEGAGATDSAYFL